MNQMNGNNGRGDRWPFGSHYGQRPSGRVPGWIPGLPSLPADEKKEKEKKSLTAADLVAAIEPGDNGLAKAVKDALTLAFSGKVKGSTPSPRAQQMMNNVRRSVGL